MSTFSDSSEHRGAIDTCARAAEKLDAGILRHAAMARGSRNPRRAPRRVRRPTACEQQRRQRARNQQENARSSAHRRCCAPRRTQPARTALGPCPRLAVGDPSSICSRGCMSEISDAAEQPAKQAKRGQHVHGGQLRRRSLHAPRCCAAARPPEKDRCRRP